MRMTKFTHACVRLDDGDRSLVLDPGEFSECAEALDGASAVLITHEHFDHLNVEALLSAARANPDLRVWAPSSVVEKLAELGSRAVAVNAGESFDAAGFSVRAFGGQHAVIHPAIGTPCANVGYLVNDAAYFLGIPYVWGSIYRFDGQASVFAAGLRNSKNEELAKAAENAPCYRCLYPEPPPPGMVPSCAEGGVLGVLCASIGSIQVNEAIKLLAGIGEPLVGELIVYDALEMEYRKLKVRKDPNCRLCGEHPEVTGLIDYDYFCGNLSDEAADAAAGSTISVG